MADRVDVGAARRVQIVEAASRVIARSGFHSLTLAEVEAEAGISRGMMTYHFPSKDAMIQAVFKSVVDRLAERNSATIDAASPAERVAATIDSALRAGSRDEDFRGIYYSFLALATHREEYRSAFARVEGAMRDRLTRDLIDLGRDPDSANSIGGLILATLRGVSEFRHLDVVGIDQARIARSLRAIAGLESSSDQMV